MIDFETLDVKPSAAVASVGVVLFDQKHILWSRYWLFDIDSQFPERTVSADTLRWWMTQSKEAQSPFHDTKAKRVDLETFCKQFLVEVGNQLNCFGNNWRGLNVWGNGACFDIPILDSILRGEGRDIPYLFWNIICYRTFDKLTKCKSLVERQGTHHNAEDDAIFQAETVLAHYKKGKK